MAKFLTGNELNSEIEKMLKHTAEENNKHNYKRFDRTKS